MSGIIERWIAIVDIEHARRAIVMHAVVRLPEFKLGIKM